MDAVLCGEVPVAFHDEAMVLYYLNHELINFGAGKYIPRVGNCDTKRNPHEDTAWGKGRNYQWGEADSDNKGGKACALTFTGAKEESVRPKNARTAESRVHSSCWNGTRIC